jgi:dTDP-glucose 4,6-dehydratase
LIFVTGGSGFIGTNLVEYLIDEKKIDVLNIDVGTYAANNYLELKYNNNKKYQRVKCSINDTDKLSHLFDKYKPRGIMHLAAESHVDNSIFGPKEFITTNVVGTANLLDMSMKYWQGISSADKRNFTFLHVSTDEVYGSLSDNDAPFTEMSQYNPSSPYSASKASSDHLVKAYFKTYGLPTKVTNCSNNYGPHQHGEKLIPKMINNAISCHDLELYGSGLNIRDWLYVKDHCIALYQVFENGLVGESYNIGGNHEIANIELISYICRCLDEMRPLQNKKYEELITFVPDRLGHDWRYAINNSKILKSLNWTPKTNFKDGIYQTIYWYLNREKTV